MKRPLFSCVIPVKGARPYFDEALDSLQNQGMGDDLEIIVQDGDVEADKGQSDALNKGFAKARGEWLFWLNADDVLLPGALKSLELRIKSLKFKDGEWIAGDTVYIDANGIVKDVRTDAKWYPWYGRKLSVWTGGPSAFFRRRLWEQHGGFDVDFKYVMDIDLWTRWGRNGIRFESAERYLWGFRMHQGSKTMGGQNCSAHAAERMQVLETHGLNNQIGWRNLTRLCSVLNGRWFKRWRDGKRLFGVNWKGLRI